MAWSVFLSSTIHDFGQLRYEVQEALLKKAEAACFLSEDWGGGYDDTVEKCKQGVLGANGFFLLLGYYYGSIPPGQRRSITHLEFEWANEKWRGIKFPPIAVMLPKEPSEAERKLKAAAQGILSVPGTQGYADAAEHEQLLSGFHQAAKSSWRTVIPFEDEGDLRENVIVSCLKWKGRTPMAAARRGFDLTGASAPQQVADDRLGRLGRQRQFAAISTILADVTDAPESPALAIVVPGPEDAGQRAFLSALVRSTFQTYSPRSRLSRLPLAHNGPAVLSSWVAGQLGLVRGSVPQTPEQLAELVANELGRQPLYFILDRVADLAGSLVAFRNAFWLPFYAALKQLRAQRRFDNRLVAVVSDYSGQSWPSEVQAFDASTLDYSKLLLLPTLGSFTRRDLLGWMDEQSVDDTPAGRRKLIADRALKNDAGVEDPVPTRVFDRLRGEALWPEEEQ